MALAAGVWVVNTAMLANPVGLVVAGFVAAGAIIYALWDPIGEAVGRLWEKIEKLWGWIKKVGDAIKNSPIGKWVRRQFGDDSVDDEPTTASRAPTRRVGRGRVGAGRARAAGVAAAPADDDGTDDAPATASRGPRRRGRGGAGRMLVAGVVAAPVAAAAAPAPAPDYTAMQDEATRIGRAFEAARSGAVTPPERVADIDLKALRGDVQALTDRFDLSQAPAPAPPPSDDERLSVAGAPQGVPAAQPGTVRGASLVFHQTFHFHGTGPESEDELRRRMKDIMRGISVEAGLVEAEDAF